MTLLTISVEAARATANGDVIGLFQTLAEYEQSRADDPDPESTLRMMAGMAGAAILLLETETGTPAADLLQSAALNLARMADGEAP